MTRKEKAAEVLTRLRATIPDPVTELQYGNPYELLVAVILSAQCTDARVNLVTPGLFAAYPTPHAMAEATPEQVFEYISSISYPNQKSKHLVGMAKKLVAEFGGEVPDAIEALVTLPGVGRKTAQVVVSVAYGFPALPVDTHIFRVANRIGLAKNAPTVEAVEKQLKAAIPRSDWGEAHHLLILHGRYTCIARAPKCEVCPLTDVCDYYAALQKLPAPLPGLDARRARYYCQTCATYFDSEQQKTDRYGTTQLACPACGSMSVFETKTGRTTKQVRDYRV